jgi:hypothetical protein
VGHPQHVVQRGHNREACFFAEEDYQFYLHWLREGARKYGCAIHAYVLMTNRVHLLEFHGNDILDGGGDDTLLMVEKCQSPRYGEYMVANDREWRRAA